MSGHRRYAAAKLAGLQTVPCRVESIKRADDIDVFVLLLREYNRQRDKSLAEKLREEIVTADPKESYRALTDYRQEQARLSVPPMEIRGLKSRAKISDAKQPFLDAVLRVIKERQAFWPLSDRSIHYALLNDPPLKHASKPDSRYGNTMQSYKSLVDLLTRGRLDYSIAWNAIADPTRPVTTWNVHSDPRNFHAKGAGFVPERVLLGRHGIARGSVRVRPAVGLLSTSASPSPSPSVFPSPFSSFAGFLRRAGLLQKGS